MAAKAATPRLSIGTRKLATDLRKALVYHDRHIMVVNKWPGMIVQGKEGASLASNIEAAALRSHDKPQIVHRLDADTSGVLVIARHPAAARVLHRLFSNGKVEKTYVAITMGVPSPPNGIIESLVGTRRDSHELLAVPPAQIGQLRTSSVAKAKTSYRVLNSVDTHACLLELQPQTGRRHQLRTHCAHMLRTPIVGDFKYGIGISPFIRTSVATKRGTIGSLKTKKFTVMLHASGLRIPNYADVMKEADEGIHDILRERFEASRQQNQAQKDAARRKRIQRQAERALDTAEGLTLSPENVDSIDWKALGFDEQVAAEIKELTHKYKKPIEKKSKTSSDDDDGIAEKDEFGIDASGEMTWKPSKLPKVLNLSAPPPTVFREVCSQLGFNKQVKTWRHHAQRDRKTADLRKSV